MARYTDVEKLMQTLGIADECKKCTFCIGAICTNESDFVDACTAIAEAPTADVQEVITLESAIDFLHKIGWLQEHDKELTEVKHGKWLVIENDEDELWEGGGHYECTACGYGFSFGGFFEMNTLPFCPHCGAKMEVPDEEPT